MIEADSTEPSFRAASPRERYLLIASALGVAAVLIASAPSAGRALGSSDATFAALFSATIVMMCVSALISYNWYLASGIAAYAMHATAFGATAVLVAAYAVTFPGVLPAGTTAAGLSQAAGYLWLAYHLVFYTTMGFSLAAQRWLARRRRLGEPVESFVRRYVAAVAFGTLFLALAIPASAPYLPALVDSSGGYTANVPFVTTALFGEIALVAAALAGMTRLRRRIDVWFAITLVALCGELVLATVLTSQRFTFGWYAGKTLGCAGLVTFFFAQFGQIAAVLGALARDRRALTTSAGRDALTGLVNRRSFDEQLEDLWRTARASNTPISLVIADIDFFKQYNDRYGHPGGDDALRIFARTIVSASRRPSDVCARIGGEEFAVILPATDAGGAYLVAETIRATLEERRIPHSGGFNGRLTASFGVAASNERGVDTLRELHQRADEALYEAKRLGRNRVFTTRRATPAYAVRDRA